MPRAVFSKLINFRDIRSMHDLLNRNFWLQKWMKFKKLCRFLKHCVTWLIFNFAISLVPVLIAFSIDYRLHSDNFNYSDTVFLAIMSYSFTLLVTSGYSMIVWEQVKPLAAGGIIFFMFIIAGVCFHYYNALPNFTEYTFPKILSDNKFSVANLVVIVTLFFSFWLNYATIEKCLSDEIDREEKKKQEKLTSQFSDLNDQL